MNYSNSNKDTKFGINQNINSIINIQNQNNITKIVKNP